MQCCSAGEGDFVSAEIPRFCPLDSNSQSPVLSVTVPGLWGLALFPPWVLGLALGF